MKSRRTQTISQRLLGGVVRTAPGVLVLLLGLLSLHLPSLGHAAQLSDESLGRQWEEIALIRQEAAWGHESKAEDRESSQEGTFAEGQEGAGDEKALASGMYRLASQNWIKAAKAYDTFGGGDKVQIAQFNADTNLEAARRTLIEAIEYHRRAAKHYGDSNRLDKKTITLEKLAVNLELLMKLE